jgi:hypothetical protein
MATQNRSPLRPGSSDMDVVSLELRRIEAARRSVQDRIADISAGIVQTDRDQLDRDIADIERATAALQRAEPALQSWTDASTRTVRKPRPLWLLIGVLWLSTALVTAGAVVAIATLAG